jgi:hypothetical protein
MDWGDVGSFLLGGGIVFGALFVVHAVWWYLLRPFGVKWPESKWDEAARYRKVRTVRGDEYVLLKRRKRKDDDG